MEKAKLITNKAEINAMLDITGRDFHIPTCPEPQIHIDNPHAIIDINEKPLREPDENEIKNFISSINKLHVSEYQSERDALIAIYEAANGKNWHNKTNWCKANVPVSNWYGVTVAADYVFTYGGKILRVMGHVTELNLRHNNIYCSKDDSNGFISPRIKDLTKLRALRLEYNFIQGHIPDELYELKELERLYLQFNQLEGGINTKIGQLTKLRWVQLDHNHLSGAIPSSFANLANLERLCLHLNNLENGYSLVRPLRKPDVVLQRKSVNIPAGIANLKKLAVFMVYKNRLSGTIPAAIKKHPYYSQWKINPQQNDNQLK